MTPEEERAAALQRAEDALVCVRIELDWMLADLGASGGLSAVLPLSREEGEEGSGDE